MTTTEISTTEIKKGDIIACVGRNDFRTVQSVEADGASILVLTFTKDSEPVVHTNRFRRADQLRVRRFGQLVTRQDS